MTKVKVKEPFTSGGKCFDKNQVVEVEDGFALNLINGGLADKEAAAKTPAKKAVKKDEGK